MTRSTSNPWLHRFSFLLAVTVLGLLCVGGLVTSHGAGMAVPDWPNTFGYNMFFFPISKWVGGVFYEHSHRLLASLVGFLTIILAVWLWISEERRWLRWCGVAALGAVIFQGVLGGLRVVWMKDEIGIFHAALAQLFFALVCSMVLFSSRWWIAVRLNPAQAAKLRILRSLALWTTALIFVQLLLGASMRHQHAGLSIPDFPLAYGKVWPATDADSVARYNQQRSESVAFNPITSFQVLLQMVHRLAAVTILVMVAITASLAWRRTSGLLRVFLAAWPVLIMFQVVLGAATIWTNKSADVATAHVAIGALSLVNGTLLFLGCSRCLWRTSTEPAANAKAVPTFSIPRPAEVPA